eukprot:TRINITY_DN6181_c0_g1_i8.p1 TRINITY_DN6181_c0_g1~~TRINITY_DN6181_c0_g1_i8.p1  ORF type:complete len:183 (+),score=40.35 TRINITY_DN6181_c0_g1_i8:424-972(+)
MQKTYPCRLYFIYSVTDLFLLTYGCYLILRAVESVSQNWPTLAFESGRYGKHKLKSWFYQLIIWLFIVFLAKICTFSFNLVFASFFNYLAAAALYPFREDPKMELATVMVLIPILTTSIQLWWTDSFIQDQVPCKDSEDLKELSISLVSGEPVKEERRAHAEDFDGSGVTADTASKCRGSSI